MRANNMANGERKESMEETKTFAAVPHLKKRLPASQELCSHPARVSQEFVSAEVYPVEHGIEAGCCSASGRSLAGQ